MPYLILEKPRITVRGGKTRVCAYVFLSGESSQNVELWYEIDSDYKQYLYEDRADMFLAAILPYCMEKGYDIQVSVNTKVSAGLLYQLKQILIPSLKDAQPFRSISIDAAPIYESLQHGGGVATGVSGGVDSFYTILKNMDGLFPLSYLTLFNVQGFGEYGGAAARKNFHRNIEKAQKICRELNEEYGTSLKLITVDSNIQEELPVSINYGGTYRDAGAILLLRQLFKIYYFAADTKLDTFRVSAAGRFFSPWAYYCFSTEECRIQLFGADADRIDKVDYISRFPITYDNLRVCRGPFVFGSKGLEFQYEKNCTCNCDKCRHTVLELMAAGKLQEYRASFDLDAVHENYQRLLTEVVEKKEQLFYKELYRHFLKKGEISECTEQENSIERPENQIAFENHDAIIMELMDCFLQKLQSNISFQSMLKSRRYDTVAIYGMGRLGRCLYRELKDMVAYEIDRNKEMVYGHVPIVSPGEEFRPVDLVVITTVYDIEAIRRLLTEKLTCKIMTLRELLNMEP